MICPKCGGYIEMDESDINGCCDTCNTYVEAGQLISDESTEEIELKVGEKNENN